MKFSMLVAVVITSFIAVPAFAESEGYEGREDSQGRGPRGHRGPPPEAIEACSGKASGDVCSFTGRRGEDLEGTCGIGRGGETQIACRPTNHPHMNPSEGRALGMKKESNHGRTA